MKTKACRLGYLLVMVSVVVFSIMLSGMSVPVGQAAEITKFEIGGGSVGGIYYVTANAFADVLSKKLGMNIPFTASATKGSGQNIGLLDLDRIEAATVSANGLYTAWEGMEPYDKKYRTIRLVMRVFPNPSVFFALAKSNITKISQLKGKRVGCGSGVRTWAPVTKPILEAHGMDYDKDIKKVFGGFTDLCNQVRDGLISGSIGNVSAGVTLMPALAALAAERKLAWLEWDPKVIESLPAKLPYYSKAIVSASALPGRKTNYTTLDIGTQNIVVRDDLPEELVYKITKALHESFPELAKSMKILRHAVSNPKFVTNKLGTVQFHPGSVRYWKDVGLWQK